MKRQVTLNFAPCGNPCTSGSLPGLCLVELFTFMQKQHGMFLSACCDRSQAINEGSQERQEVLGKGEVGRQNRAAEKETLLEAENPWML